MSANLLAFGLTCVTLAYLIVGVRGFGFWLVVWVLPVWLFWWLIAVWVCSGLVSVFGGCVYWVGIIQFLAGFVSSDLGLWLYFRVRDGWVWVAWVWCFGGVLVLGG